MSPVVINLGTGLDVLISQFGRPVLAGLKPAGFRNGGSWFYEGAGASAIAEAPAP